MGILQSIKEKVGSKVHEYQEGRARDRSEYEEHYARAYEKNRAAEIRKSAEENAARDAHNRVHPLERITKGLESIQKFGGNAGREVRQSTRQRPSRGSSGNSLARTLSPLGDFGRGIGRQYENPSDHLPSALRDFDKPFAARKRR